MPAAPKQLDMPDIAPVSPRVVASHVDEGFATYVALTGQHPASATIDSDLGFDRHVFASILAVGSTEGDPLAARVGLGNDDLTHLIGRWFPRCGALSARSATYAVAANDDETVMVRDLLLAHQSTPGDDGRWLAGMIARRAMEPNHLWEDLGLRNRGELSRLLTRHFAPLAVRNSKNMRWKRFFYRALCEDDGMVMCSTPVCAHCGDFELCFGQEDGESRLAYRRRQFALTSATA